MISHRRMSKHTNRDKAGYYDQRTRHDSVLTLNAFYITGTFWFFFKEYFHDILLLVWTARNLIRTLNALVELWLLWFHVHLWMILMHNSPKYHVGRGLILSKCEANYLRGDLLYSTHASLSAWPAIQPDLWTWVIVAPASSSLILHVTLRIMICLGTKICLKCEWW